MLTFDVLGFFALGVMWLSTALIVAVALSDGFRAAKLVFAAICCAGILTAAIGVTVMALTPPYFGPWSTAGGALGLVYFLLVQPLGVMLRQRMLRSVTHPHAEIPR
jgi:hypothetical protein